ncbi:hypothetical protein PM082_001588 [Marasmius tenuissimus]|nr:hypothetical protein PM082_001588 [Marasmius tenuissimus]
MYSILSFAVLCCALLGQRTVLAAPAGRLVLPRQQDESSITTFPGHLHTLGLATPPEQANTVSALSNVVLPTTFTVARVESGTTVYQVQTVTLYPFQSASATTSSTPITINGQQPTSLGAASQSSSSGDKQREMLFWVAAAACLAVIIPILAIFLILCLRKRAYIRSTDNTPRWRDTSTLKVEERREDGFSFGVADGKIWMAKSDKAEEKKNRRLLRSLDRF